MRIVIPTKKDKSVNFPAVSGKEDQIRRVRQETAKRNLEDEVSPGEAEVNIKEDIAKTRNVRHSQVWSGMRSDLSEWLNWIYRNELGCFCVDILSVAIQLTMVLLGVRPSSATISVFAPNCSVSLRGSIRSVNNNNADVPEQRSELPGEHKAGNTDEHQKDAIEIIMD